jgi:hypothetical protein
MVGWSGRLDALPGLAAAVAAMGLGRGRAPHPLRRAATRYDFSEAMVGLLAPAGSLRTWFAPHYFGGDMHAFYTELNASHAFDDRWHAFGHSAGCTTARRPRTRRAFPTASTRWWVSACTLSRWDLRLVARRRRRRPGARRHRRAAAPRGLDPRGQRRVLNSLSETSGSTLEPRRFAPGIHVQALQPASHSHTRSRDHVPFSTTRPPLPFALALATGALLAACGGDGEQRRHDDAAHRRSRQQPELHHRPLRHDHLHAHGHHLRRCRRRQLRGQRARERHGGHAGAAPRREPRQLVGPGVQPDGLLVDRQRGHGTSTLYDGNGVAQSLVVTLNQGNPSGIVFNGSTAFSITEAGVSGAAPFIFATLQGQISAWSPGVDGTHCVHHRRRQRRGRQLHRPGDRHGGQRQPALRRRLRTTAPS